MVDAPQLLSINPAALPLLSSQLSHAPVSIICFSVNASFSLVNLCLFLVIDIDSSRVTESALEAKDDGATGDTQAAQ